MSQHQNHDATKPTLFQVDSIGPYPPQIESVTKSGHLVMLVKYRNHPRGWKGTRWDIDPQRYRDNIDSMLNAAKSQAWYWTELGFDETPPFPPRLDDTVLDRILNAISQKQIVADDHPE